VKTLYTATATATDRGRNGHTRTDDGKLDLDLSMPEAMGGPGGDGTNPEQLFAAGWASCFVGAVRRVAGAKKVPLNDLSDRLRDNYLYARAVVGNELSWPVINRLDS